MQLNVGGVLHTTTRETLMREPSSRLALMARGVLPCPTGPDGSLFIDRSPKFFQISEYPAVEGMPDVCYDFNVDGCAASCAATAAMLLPVGLEQCVCRAPSLASILAAYLSMLSYHHFQSKHRGVSKRGQRRPSDLLVPACTPSPRTPHTHAFTAPLHTHTRRVRCNTCCRFKPNRPPSCTSPPPALNYLRDGWVMLPKAPEERRELLQEIRWVGGIPTDNEWQCFPTL